MLEQVHEALWVVDGENVSFYGIPYPTRSLIAVCRTAIYGYGRQSS